MPALLGLAPHCLAWRSAGAAISDHELIGVTIAPRA